MATKGQIITTFAGGGTSGFCSGCTATSCRISDPVGGVFDTLGNYYFASCLGGNSILKVNTTGIITDVAGTGTSGFFGDGGQATAAELYAPQSVQFDTLGNMYILDALNWRIRKVSVSTGVITTIAGTGTAGYNGENIPATSAKINASDICLDKAGNIYIAEYNNRRVRKIDISGIITTIAGNGIVGSSGDGGPATDAMLSPNGITIDDSNNLYVPDPYGSVVRKILPSGIISTIAGNGVPIYSGDGIPATDATFQPAHICIDFNRNLYVSDGYNDRVFRIDTNGVFWLAAGNGSTGFSGDGGSATLASFNYCSGVSTDQCGNLYITEPGNGRIRKVTFNPSISPISGLLSVCLSSTITLTDTSSGGIWSSSNGNATISSSGVVTGISDGTDTITYSVTNSCGTNYVTAVITVNSLPTVDTISGSTEVCLSSSITLADTTAGGAWSASNSNAVVSSGGIVTGMYSGIDTIVYSDTNSCHIAVATTIITIYPILNVGTITGNNVLCTSDTLSDSTIGGTWNSSNTNASISAGIVTGLSAGLDTISYSLTNICGTAITTKVVSINPLPDAGTITGTTIFCLGAADTVTGSVAGGVWSTGTAGIVSISSSGIITSITSGSAVISYSVSNSLCTVAATANIIVSTYPNAGIITGADSVCIGSAITLTDTFSTGITLWQASDSLITTVAGGSSVPLTVTGVTAGTDTIIYTVTNSCGTGTAKKAITVKTTPNAGIITAADSVCIGISIILSDSITGGSWSISNTNATLAATILTGVSVGLDTISYSLSNDCGTTTITKIVTVNTIITPVSITGTDSVCPGNVITLADATTSGLWSCTNPNATITTDGVVTGVNTGTDTITYSITNSCGTGTASQAIIIKTLPDAGIITGTDSVCVGASITETATATGGLWSCTNPNATVISGAVSGVAAGLDTVNYTVSNSCGVAVVAMPLTVLDLPNPGYIFGLDSVCVGAYIALHDSVAGGTMSCTTPVATLDTSDKLTGLIPGLDTVFYSVTNSCGTSIATKTVTVLPLPYAGTISASDSLCTHATILLNDSISGGIYTPTNSNAMVSGDTLRATTTGMDTIIYIVTNSCGADTGIHPVKILPLPAAGTISSDSINYCIGTTATLIDSGAVGTGAWLATDSNVLTNPPTTGVSSVTITSMNIGNDTILYIAANTCGADTARYPITITDKPAPPIVTGITIVCYNRNDDTLHCSTTGGTWTATNTSTTISSAGVVTATISGKATDTIIYTISNQCGATSDSFTITIPTKDSCDAISAVPQVTNLAETIQVYPNPAHDLITVVGAQDCEFRILDIVGKDCFVPRNDATGEYIFDVSKLINGIYLMEITNPQTGMKTTRKIIKM